MLRLQNALPDAYSSATPEELADRIRTAKQTLGSRVFILGHHYQRDEVMVWADARGDSFGLSRIAAGQTEAEYIVFCGVHFMAESADILTGDHQQVLLPDLNAGCSMADMADIDSVEEAWETLSAVTDIDRVVPVTYMNSSAALKAFVGRNSGVVCTSSNARAVLSWALGEDGTGASRGDQVLFFPDQHLGRNTGFVVVHPECSHDTVEVADLVGSTDFIIRAVAEAPVGSVIGVGTEIHLVKRLDDETPDKTVVSLDPLVCPCSTMFRIDAAHLAWVLEGLVEGDVRNRIVVDDGTATWAKVALERMLATI
jgi:quinolinate synthase